MTGSQKALSWGHFLGGECNLDPIKPSLNVTQKKVSWRYPMNLVFLAFQKRHSSYGSCFLSNGKSPLLVIQSAPFDNPGTPIRGRILATSLSQTELVHLDPKCLWWFIIHDGSTQTKPNCIFPSFPWLLISKSHSISSVIWMYKGFSDP